MHRDFCCFVEQPQRQLGAYESRRFPPHPTPVQNGQTLGAISLFPMMPADGGCGKFEARLPAPVDPPAH